MFQLLAQATDYTYSTSQTASNGIPPIVALLYLAVVVLLLAAMWKVFQKAGKPGWAALVPFYNTWVMVQIAGKPTWWFFLMFVPLVNLIIAVLLYVEIAKAFGKGAGFTVLLILVPFVGFPILGFGKSTYKLPAAAGSTSAQPGPTPPPADPATPSSPASPTSSTDSTPPATPTPPVEPKTPTETMPPASTTPTDAPSTASASADSSDSEERQA